MLKIIFRKLNMDAILKISLLLGFATFFFITVKNGTIHMFVHPRIISFIKIGIVVMLTMSLFQLKEIFKPQGKQFNFYQYLFFIIPLIMAFTLPAKEVNLGTVSFGSKTDNMISKNSTVQSKVLNNERKVSNHKSEAPINGSRVSNNENYEKLSKPYSLQSNNLSSEFTDGNGSTLADETLPHDIYTEDNYHNTNTAHNNENTHNTHSTHIIDNSKNTNNPQNTDATQISDVSLYVNGNEGESRGLKLQDDTVVMDDSNFAKWVDEISNNPLKYEGKKVTVSGFVFKDKQFKSNEFVPARMMMTCCVADMSIVGLPAKYELASELKQDSWFKFSGTIVNGEFNGQLMPIINIESAQKIGKPQYEYVYPY